MSSRHGWILVVVLLIAPSGVYGQGVACPLHGGMAGAMVSRLCYNCFFPIQIAGMPFDPRTPVLAMSVGPICVCPSIYFGIPTAGVTYGQWLPLRMVETVRTPFCSAIAGNLSPGSNAGAASQRLLGGFIGDVENHSEKEGFYHFHWFAFPLGVMADMNVSQVCKDNSGMDLDLLYLSELDPTWMNDALAILLTPEAALFANAAAQMACLADAVASTAQPIDALFWCAGTWGEMYPHTGHSPHRGSPPQMHSLVATRATAAMHRRGLAEQMMGPTAICANHPQPIIPKSQYRLQTIYPIAEEQFNHPIGMTPFIWGEWRNIPGLGEDWVSIVWGYEQCCIND